MNNDVHTDFLKRCVELASEAYLDGDQPFGSILVDSSGSILFEDRNRTRSLEDNTRHPEFEIARWATENVPAEERKNLTVYTSGEHCAMCSTAHTLVGLGDIYFATSTGQLVEWFQEWGISRGTRAPLTIQDVDPGIQTFGPFPEFAEEIRTLHAKAQNVE